MNILSAGSPSNKLKLKKKQPPVTLKIADLSTLSLSGCGINFGRIFVFLRSVPIIEVPLGSMTPPCIELK